jgi:hypothetical protein
MIGLFGAGDGGRRLYANGANWDLLGRSVAQLPTAAPTGARVELDSAALLDRFRPGAPLVPSYVSGRIAGGVGAGASLAVAVNGRIGAVTESFVDGDDVRLAGIVPARLFRAGSNALEIFAIEASGGAPQLASLATERPETYRLVEKDGQTAIEGAGRAVPVEEGRLQGFVDKFEIDDQGARLAGWAVEPGGPVPAERVLVFAGTRLVAQGRPTLVRPDIVERYSSPAVSRSGFELRGSAGGAAIGDLRVFAIGDGAATELPRYEP